MRTIGRKIAGMELPAIEKISEGQKKDAFQILISTLLSARTKDETTLAASTRLFKRAPTAQAVAALTVKQIEKLIYPVGFYRNKAVFVKEASRTLVTKFGGVVPSTLEQLVTLPGVGRKTANLVMILAFQSETSICVDIHVHRICQPAGLGAGPGPRGHRTGALSRDRAQVVAAHQPLPGHMGPEHLPAGVSSMWRMRHHL